MTLSDRDRQLAIFIPAFLILAGSGILLASSGKIGELKKAEAEMAKAEAAAPSKDKLLHQQLHVQMASKRTAEAAKEVEDARKRFHETIRCADPTHRAERIHKLTTLLSDHGLVVLEHDEAEAGKDRVPPKLQEFAKSLPIPSPPKLHRIKFLARYSEACQVAASLSRDGAIAIPVGLTMTKRDDPRETKSDQDWHLWTLLVWV